MPNVRTKPFPTLKDRNLQCTAEPLRPKNLQLSVGAQLQNKRYRSQVGQAVTETEQTTLCFASQRGGDPTSPEQKRCGRRLPRVPPGNTGRRSSRRSPRASSPDVWRLSLSEVRSPKPEFGNEGEGSRASEPLFKGRKNGGFFVHTKGARNSSSTGAFSVLNHTRLPCRAGGCRDPCSRS